MSYETLTEKLQKGKKDDKFFVTVIPVSEHGEVLLGKRIEDGIWTTPGGGADPGEAPEQAARRELFEEAGLAAPPNSLELVSVSETPRGFKIYSFLWRMPRMFADAATPKLDPDKEVKSWKLFRPEDFPASMASEQNASRLKTIREALMRLYAIKANMEDEKDLEKGGPGSGVKGHQTQKPSKDAQRANNMAESHRQMVATSNEAHLRQHPQYNKDDHAHLKGKGYSDSEIKALWDRDHKDQKKPVSGKVKAPDAVGHAHGDQKTEPQKMRDARRGIKHEEDTRTEAQRMADTRRGGPGFKRDWGKSEDEVLSLVDKLNKAGQFEESKHPRANDGKFGHGAGSGGGGDDHKHDKLNDIGFAAQDAGSDFDEKHYGHLPPELKSHIEKIKAAADKFHETDEDSPGYAAAEKKLGDVTLAYQQAAKKLIGEQSKKTPSSSHAPVHSDPAKPKNKLQAHLEALEGGGVIPGVKTQSDKPVVTSMDQAKALGYDVQDHVDAMNAHYELAQKTQAMLEKLKAAGHKVPKEGAKIAQFHQKKMQEHMRARQYLEERKKHTSAAIKVKKQDAIDSVKVKKAITQMGGGLGDRDLAIGDFAQANNSAHTGWLEILYSGMEGFQFADEPRSFPCPTGSLLLAKVDDGLYSGSYTKIDSSGLEDHARVRIERMTIPELVQFMVAQEWIKNPVLDPPTDTVQEIGQDYASAMDHVAGQIEAQEQEAELMALNEALRNPQDVPPGGSMEQKIRMLDLISKLLS